MVMVPGKVSGQALDLIRDCCKSGCESLRLLLGECGIADAAWNPLRRKPRAPLLNWASQSLHILPMDNL